MTCPATLNAGPLTCQRTTAHDPGHGCVFAASSVSDLHDASEAQAEGTRG